MLRLFAAAFVLFAALWVTVRVYVAHETRRAIALVNEAQRIHVWDNEASVLSLVKQYSGSEFVPYTADELDRKNRVDVWRHEYLRRHFPERAYRVDVVPSSFGTDLFKEWGRKERLVLKVGTFFYYGPAVLRHLFGISERAAGTQIFIRNGRVSRVYTYVVAEKRNPQGSIWRTSPPRVLIAHWEVAEEMPCQDKQGASYAAQASLHSENGGEYISHYLTPKASEEQLHAAQRWNTACMTSFTGCEGVCEGVNQLSPSAIEYLKKHPEAVTNSSCP